MCTGGRRPTQGHCVPSTARPGNGSASGTESSTCLIHHQMQQWLFCQEPICVSIMFAFGMVSRKKVAVLLDFVQITSPHPQFGQLVPLFFNAKNVNLSDIQNDSLSKILLKQRQNTCFVGHVYNLKNSLKFKLLAF